MENQVFWHKTLCHWASNYRLLDDLHASIFKVKLTVYPENEGRKVLREVEYYSPSNRASHDRRLEQHRCKKAQNQRCPSLATKI
jgi:hypothetical protein